LPGGVTLTHEWLGSRVLSFRRHGCATPHRDADTGRAEAQSGSIAIRARAYPWALLLLLAAGCVTVRSAPPGFTGRWPPAEVGSRPAVLLVVSGTATVDGWPRDLGPILDLWGAATERAYRESGLFSEVLLGKGRGELRVAAQLRAEVSQYTALTALSYLTLLVLPHVVTTDVALVTRVTTDDGQPLGTIEVRGRSRTWHQLLLFPVAPLFEPNTVTPPIVYDLSRETITALHARGVF
jgi:hypothetical protein